MAELDTTTKNNSVIGNLFVFSFTVLTVAANKETTISVDVIDACDSTTSYNTINIETNEGKKITLSKTNVPAEFVALVEKLQTITINSLEDITNAEVAFKALTTSQKNAFKQHSLYKTFNDARSKYNKLLEAAKLEELVKAAENFVKANPILNKAINKLTANDAAAVEKMSEAYKLLTDNVKNKISREIREKIPQIQERVDLLVESIASTSDYKLSYSLLWETDEELILMDAEDSINLVNEALLIYDTLDEISKKNLAKQKKYLDALKEKLLAKIGDNEAKAVIEEEVIEYQKQWLSILSLSKFTVKLEDKTAIELAMAAYDKLSSGAKESLKAKYENMKALVELLEQKAGLENQGNANNNASSSQTQSSGDPTVSYVTNTVTNTVTQTVTETVTNESVIKEYMKKPVARVIFWLFATLLFAVVWAVFAYAYNKFLEKKLVPFTDVKEEE